MSANGLTVRRSICFFLAIFLICTVRDNGAGSSSARPFVVYDCPSAWAWFGKEPGYKVTLMSVGAGAQTYANPSAPDSINVDFGPARQYYTSFGRGCLGGFYDATHRVAAMYAWHENYDDTAIFFVRQPVSGFTSSSLRSLRTARGVALGATLESLVAIEGRGTRVTTVSGEQIVRYEWHQAMRGTGVTTAYYLTCLFERGQLVAIDLGKRV